LIVDVAEVEIADTGPGIASDELPRIFERFYRTEESRTTPGSGLGLSMVKAVCDLHKAEIKVQNCHPGLEFSIILAQSRDIS